MCSPSLWHKPLWHAYSLLMAWVTKASVPPLWHKLHSYFGICNFSSRHMSSSLMNSTSLLYLYIWASHPHLTHLVVLVKGEFELEKERVWESRGRLRESERVLKNNRRSWRAKVIQCLHQLLLSEIFFRFWWTSSFSHCTLYLRWIINL